jgi:hypothetical protein
MLGPCSPFKDRGQSQQFNKLIISLPLTTIIIMVVVVKLDLPVFLFLILLALSTVKKTETKRGQS